MRADGLANSGSVLFKIISVTFERSVTLMADVSLTQQTCNMLQSHLCSYILHAAYADVEITGKTMKTICFS